jgi:hypothetical protein
MLKLKDFSYRTLDRNIVFSFCITLAIYKFLGIESFPLRVVLILFLLLSLFLARNKKLESFAFGILYAATSIIVFKFFYETYRVFYILKEWDILSFYLFGKVGASGLDFYNPANFAAIYSALEIPFRVDPNFVEEIVNVGFLYPPQAMLLFAPLGFINNIETAYIIWKIFILIFLILDFILIIRLFISNLSTKIQLISIIGLMLVFPGIMSTIAYGQTNFLVLFFILLIYKNLDSWKSGVYLALAIIIKPIAAVWCLYFILNKKWNALMSLTITVALLTLVSIAFFGFHNILAYFSSPPTLRIPQWVYSELINQSLLATLLRLNIKFGFDHSFDFTSHVAVILSIVLIVLTFIASFKLSKSNQHFSFLIFIPLSLLIYPGSLTYYSVFLIPMFFEIYSVSNYKKLLVFSILILILFFSEFLASFLLLTIFIVYTFLKPKMEKTVKMTT